MSISSIKFVGFYGLNEKNELTQPINEAFCCFSLTRVSGHDEKLRFKSFRILTDFNIWMIVNRRSDAIYCEDKLKFYIKDIQLNVFDKMILQNILELETIKNGN